ncbi:MAG: amino acid permease [Nanoarchaeota archaeon]|nr:amino acid permease [Nanoarchaeota archaeon]MBU1321767.1 amino acid permease [Nanoarchaeota archaeon]MBU1598466.1 amino acid permease [Nanoarchaeota archaeon]MBU2442302.1 amino acid permease [Nanoarchaeota archaeon]
MAELKRGFGFWTILALLLTAMVGTGMFFGTSLGAARVGNAVLIAWVLVILLSLYVAGCFGELVALFPKAGGVYEYSKQAYGRFVSFLVGWVTWLMATIGMIVTIIAALDYLFPAAALQTSIFGIDLKIVVAIIIILVLNFIAFLGVDASAAILMIFALITMGVLVSIIVPGIFDFQFNNLTPLFTGPFILIFAAMFFMLEALMGWEEASFLAEETKNPEKIIPRALIISTLIAGVLTILVAAVSLNLIPWARLANLPAPIQSVSALLFGAGGARLISWGIVLSLIGAAAGVIISTPRLILGMARDKLFIAQLAAVHEKRRTPHKAIIFQTIVAILILLLTAGNYEALLSLFTPTALLVYIAVLLSVTILRFKMPNAKRPFKVFFGKIGPIIVSLVYLGVIVVWAYFEGGALSVLGRMVSLILFGIPIYLLLIFFYNPDAIVGFSNYFAGLTLWMENILLPKHIRKKIVDLFKDMEGKYLLEYGSGVGTLTMHLAQEVGPRGKIYATDMSHRNVKILKKRLAKNFISHVEVIHDPHQVNRIHPDVKDIDAVFSVGMMSYMQDYQKILLQMNRLLPEGGRICFVDYINFFKFLPDAPWISNREMLRTIFRKAGFSVKIERKRGILWNYLFVYGIKSERDVPMI